MSIHKYITKTKTGYITKDAIYYYNKRYDQCIEINVNFKSDGATCYWDLDSLFWLAHDYLKIKRQWKHGSHCSNFQASIVAFDILVSENRYIHAPIVFLGTMLWGYTKQIFKGLK